MLSLLDRSSGTFRSWRTMNTKSLSLHRTNTHSFIRSFTLTKWPLETTRLIIEATSYITVGSFANPVIILLKNIAVFFIKLGKLDKNVMKSALPISWKTSNFPVLSPLPSNWTSPYKTFIRKKSLAYSLSLKFALKKYAFFKKKEQGTRKQKTLISTRTALITIRCFHVTWLNSSIRNLI